MDRCPGDLSDCLDLRIGFDCVEADHGGRMSAMGGARPQVVAEGDPAPGGGLGL
jgi:hypothetical protein